jgi:hypothetical protein
MDRARRPSALGLRRMQRELEHVATLKAELAVADARLAAADAQQAQAIAAFAALAARRARGRSVPPLVAKAGGLRRGPGALKKRPRA